MTTHAGALATMPFPFPASVAFEADRGVTPTVWRVYRLLRLTMDFAEVRAVPSWWVAENTGIKRQHVGKALTWLVEHGYLTEHERESPDNQPRRFTLTWTVSVSIARESRATEALTPALQATR